MANIRDELWALSGKKDVHAEVKRRTTERIGERPPEGPFQITWRSQTDEQVAWDEQYMFEHAALIAERMAATANHDKELQEFEDYLSAEAAKAHPEDQQRDE